ncbi:dihydroneopterin aldolase [Vallicoccus soli]|uniref:7,8-dihydroneopterin aldolase n=1 Tax=Vallicoccus soli TaxID=2339232 RepID=A0A3A3Z0J7_9ACTN|nr:dihydroneopterin aldolase [Vallicoccus soli]RJK96031.1 dihydroneopterin aldolase [Vallicoccus soli]
MSTGRTAGAGSPAGGGGPGAPRRGLDRIALRGVRARGRHGVLAHEREGGQWFVVDVVLELDTAPAAATDDLALTADYGAVARAVVGLVEGEPVALVETLAERVAALCLAQGPVQAVEVTVHKPQAPVDVPFEDVAVTVRRTRG